MIDYLFKLVFVFSLNVAGILPLMYVMDRKMGVVLFRDYDGFTATLFIASIVLYAAIFDFSRKERGVDADC